MATLISKATGNFTDSGTWDQVSTAAELDSVAASTVSTTSYVYSSTFTLAAEEVDAVAVRVASRVASPTGTVSIILANNTSPGTREIEVTINVSNLANLQSYGQGWTVFKGTAITPNGTDVYKIGFKTSVTGEVNLHRNATAANWTRNVRRTATAAPAASDKLLITGEWDASGGGTLTSFTVTMNETATTSYGPTVSGGPPEGMSISAGGTLTYGTSASTNYYLKLKGVLAVYSGGTLNIGTSGTRIPSTSTAVLEHASVANVDSGLFVANGGTLNVYGQEITTPWAHLAADASASATSLTSDVSTGWKNGDEVCLASTTRTFSQSEKKTLSADASGTTLTIAALTNAHSGTAPTRTEIGNLTRNVKIRGLSTSLQGYIHCDDDSDAAFSGAELYFLGSGTINKRGLDAQATTGTFAMSGCACHDWGVNGLASFASTLDFTVSDCVWYNIAVGVWDFTGTTGQTLDNCLFVLTSSAAFGWINVTAASHLIMVDCAVAGSAKDGIQLQVSASTANLAVGTTTVHSCAGNAYTAGANCPDMYGCSITDCTFYRCNTGGLVLLSGYFTGLTVDGLDAFGNANYNIAFDSCFAVTLNNLALNGDTTFSTPAGITLGGASCILTITNSVFGAASGILTTHSQADLRAGWTTFDGYVAVFCDNCDFNSTVTVDITTESVTADSFVRSARHNQTDATHKSFFRCGTSEYDAAVFHTAAPSEKLSPSHASETFRCSATLGSQSTPGTRKVKVADGATKTVSVWVRKNASYVGAQPTLVVKQNIAAGVSETVLDTMTAGLSTWEQLSGTTPAPTDNAVLEVFVTCSGTAGAVNIDDWSVT